MDVVVGAGAAFVSAGFAHDHPSVTFEEVGFYGIHTYVVTSSATARRDGDT